MKNKCRILLTIALTSLLAAGCKENDISLDLDNKEDNRSLEFAAPLARIDITTFDWVKDELNDGDLIIQEDGLITIVYTDSVYLEWDKLVEIGNQADELLYPTAKVDLALEYTQLIQFNNTNEVRFDSLRMAGGDLTYTVEAPAGTTGTITISIPELLTGNTPYNRVLTVTETQNTFNISEPLAGKKIIFSQASNLSFISFTTTIDLNPVNPSDTPGTARIAYSIKDIKPEIAFGYFGQKETIKNNESLSFSLFDDLKILDEIEFFDLKVEVSAENNIGVPFSVNIDNIRMYQEEDPANVDLLQVNAANFLQLDAPEAVFGNPIIPGTNHFIIDRNNSNIVAIGNKYPNKMTCDITAHSNPEGETVQNFMGTETRLRTDLKMKMPFWLRSGSYSRSDTLDFDFNDMVGDNPEDAERIELFELYFDFLNTFPLEIYARASVVDGAGNLIDILFDDDQAIVKSGEPDLNGKVNLAEPSKFVVTVTQDQIKRFIDEEAKKIILYTRPSTYNGGQVFVKVFDTSELNVRVSMNMVAQIP